MTDYVHCFPIHKADALVHFFSSEVLNSQEAKLFSKNDLVPNPNPDSVRRLYMRILQHLFRFRPDCHSMIPIVENIQYQSFYEAPTAIMSVYLRMRQFLPHCLVYDFSLSDLLAPKLKRTCLVLSGIKNFMEFQKQRREMVLDHQKRFRADMDELQSYKKRNKELQQKIEKLTTIPPEQQAEARELAAAFADLENANMHELQQLNPVKEQIAEMKKEQAENLQKLSQMKVDVATLKEDTSKLKAQIVPAELKTEMDNMKESVKAKKLKREQVDKRLVEMQIRVQNETKTKVEIQHCLKQLQNLQCSMNKTQQHQKEVQELEAHYAEQLKELKNQSAEEAQLKRAQTMKIDKDFKQQIRRQKNKEMNDQRIDDIRGHCNQVHQKRKEMVEQIQNITDEAQHYVLQIQDLEKACSEETYQGQAVLDNLLAAMDEFHKGLESETVEGSKELEKMKQELEKRASD